MIKRDALLEKLKKVEVARNEADNYYNAAQRLLNEGRYKDSEENARKAIGKYEEALKILLESVDIRSVITESMRCIAIWKEKLREWLEENRAWGKYFSENFNALSKCLADAKRYLNKNPGRSLGSLLRAYEVISTIHSEMVSISDIVRKRKEYIDGLNRIKSDISLLENITKNITEGRDFETFLENLSDPRTKSHIKSTFKDMDKDFKKIEGEVSGIKYKDLRSLQDLLSRISNIEKLLKYISNCAEKWLRNLRELRKNIGDSLYLQIEEYANSVYREKYPKSRERFSFYRKIHEIRSLVECLIGLLEEIKTCSR